MPDLLIREDTTLVRLLLYPDAGITGNIRRLMLRKAIRRTGRRMKVKVEPRLNTRGVMKLQVKKQLQWTEEKNSIISVSVVKL